MKFVVVGTFEGGRFPEYVERAERTLSEHATGYAGVRVLARYYAIGERMFFSILETESSDALMRVVTPYLDLADMTVVPVLDGDDALRVWIETVGREPGEIEGSGG